MKQASLLSAAGGGSLLAAVIQKAKEEHVSELTRKF